MTTIEFMQKQITKCRINYDREVKRNAPEEILNNIQAKISHYEVAVEALRRADHA